MKPIIVGEIGVNFNGDMEIMYELIKMAARCGVDYIKTQQQHPRTSVPKSLWNVPRIPPWGGEEIPYIEYKERMWLSEIQLRQIKRVCHDVNIQWFASVWDDPSLQLLTLMKPAFIKIPSAKINDLALVKASAESGFPIILSTGMSTWEDVQMAVHIIRTYGNLAYILHCNSSYPCKDEDTRLSMIPALSREFSTHKIGFSSHSPNPLVSLASVSRYNAEMVEVHISIDRSMRGSDHAASLDELGLKLLVDEIKRLDVLHGESVREIYPEEETAVRRLRGG